MTQSDFLWKIAQFTSMLALTALLAGFFLAPNTSLTVLWNILIPIVPASLLITPTLWRAVCPLATINMAPNGLISRRRVNGKLLSYSGLIAIALLAVLVPARRFLFNQNSIVLAATVLAVGLLAFLLGAVFDSKAGFCSSICPVLPVERLYGHRPLIDLGNPRCPTCSACTSKGCIDLSPEKSLISALGRGRSSNAWLRSSFAVFAAAFPGFVFGYFATSDTTIASAVSVYLTISLWAAISYAAFVTLVLVAKLSARAAMSLFAGTAAALYYWFAAPGIVDALGLAEVFATMIRIGGLGLVAVWFFRPVGWRSGLPRVAGT